VKNELVKGFASLLNKFQLLKLCRTTCGLVFDQNINKGEIHSSWHVALMTLDWSIHGTRSICMCLSQPCSSLLSQYIYYYPKLMSLWETLERATLKALLSMRLTSHNFHMNWQMITEHVVLLFLSYHCKCKRFFFLLFSGLLRNAIYVAIRMRLLSCRK